MGKQYLIISTLILITSGLFGQSEDLKSIKKSIPVKKIKAVAPSEFSSDIYWFYTKTDTGLWNNKSGKVLATSVQNTSGCRLDTNWIKVYTKSSVELWNWNKEAPLIKSSSDFIIDSIDEFDIQVVVGTNLVGIYQESTKQFYLSDLNNIPNKREKLYFKKASDKWSYDVSCYRNEGNGSISWYGSTGDGWQNTVHVGPIYDKFISVDLFDMNNHGNIYNRETLKKQLTYEGELQQWDSGYVVLSSYDMSYYREDLNPVIEGLALHEYEPEEFATLFGVKLDKCWHLGQGAYLAKKASKYAFIDVTNRREFSEWYDYVHPIGTDSYRNASLYTVLNDNKIHLANDFGITSYAKNLNRIDILESNLGNEYERFDDSLRIRKYKNGNWSSFRVKWNDEALDTLTIISHSHLKGDLLVLSPRAIETPRYRNSLTKYRQGAGVLDTKTFNWKIKPLYHTITPYKGMYIASTPGNSSNTWTKTGFFDNDFKSTGPKELGCHFIVNRRLTVRDANWDFIEMDPTSFKTLQKLDSWKVSYEDTRRKDGFLFLGQFKSRSGYSGEMTIVHIIAPDLKLAPRKGFSWGSYLTDGLIIVNKQPTGIRLEAGAILEGEYEPTAQAIFDLKTKKLLTPWFHEVDESYRTVEITRKKGGATEEYELSELRNKLKP